MRRGPGRRHAAVPLWRFSVAIDGWGPVTRTSQRYGWCDVRSARAGGFGRASRARAVVRFPTPAVPQPDAASGSMEASTIVTLRTPRQRTDALRALSGSFGVLRVGCAGMALDRVEQHGPDAFGQVVTHPVDQFQLGARDRARARDA